ncbi:hypothetical protein ACFL4W_03775 [Planctomycetota bacterium]
MAPKALSLFSGGLDSLLAYEMIKRQGIEVQALWFDNCFLSAHVRMIRAGQGPEWLAVQFKEKYGVDVTVLSICDEFMDIMRDPPFGFGKHLNPCIDCKIAMLKKAKSYMAETGAEFLITGEVLGQRPMSQNRNSLNNIERTAGVNGLLLRPLCARNLEPTEPELKGIVDRDKLGDFKGRGRKPQLALAKEYGVRFIPQPAGGCLLTDSRFSERLKDFMAHGGKLDEYTAPILLTGRHFRISETIKLISGRKQEENDFLEGLMAHGVVLEPLNVPGPAGLIQGGPVDEGLVRQCAGLLTRNINKTDGDCTFEVRYGDGRKEEVTVAHAPKGEGEELLV